MLHPITHEFLSKAKEYDRSKQREACRLRNRVKASRSASQSQIPRGAGLLKTLLLHTAECLSQARIALRTRERETNGRRMAAPSIQEQTRR